MTLRTWMGGIFVIAVLSALLVPALARAERESRERDCANHLSQLYRIAQMYWPTYG